jgi:hypothetical protein
VITVGGTNGKGSTCAMLDAMLRCAGYRTGLYTSPHLLRYNERVRIDGRDVDDDALVAAFDAVEDARTMGEPVPLTYFEFGTLAALRLFAHARPDIAVLEVRRPALVRHVRVALPPGRYRSPAAAAMTDVLREVSAELERQGEPSRPRAAS